MRGGPASINRLFFPFRGREPRGKRGNWFSTHDAQLHYVSITLCRAGKRRDRKAEKGRRRGKEKKQKRGKEICVQSIFRNMGRKERDRKKGAE